MDKRGKNDSGSPEAGAVGDPGASIQTHLRATEEVLRALKKDLDYYRGQHGSILRERNDLLGLVGRLETVRGERAEQDCEQGFLREERDKLAEVFERLQKNHEQLIDRYGRLEAELAAERKQHADALEIIVYLESQIEQLTAMVEMLRDHEQFKQNVKG